MERKERGSSKLKMQCLGVQELSKEELESVYGGYSFGGQLPKLRWFPYGFPPIWDFKNVRQLGSFDQLSNKMTGF